MAGQPKLIFLSNPNFVLCLDWLPLLEDQRQLANLTAYLIHDFAFYVFTLNLAPPIKMKNWSKCL